MSYQIQVRADTSVNWASVNPVLALGEPGLDTTLGHMKLGDGVTSWAALGWWTDVPFTFPPSAGWSALNSGTVTTDINGRVSSLASSTGDAWKGELRTLTPASSYTATFYFDWVSLGTNISGSGIILKNSGGGSIITYGSYYESGGWILRSIKWTSVTAFSADYLQRTITTLNRGIPNWLRVRDDATTRFLEYSYNAIDWIIFHSVGRTDFIIPNQIGWGINSNNSGGAYTAITRLRHFSGVA
jgi:hypothetical protein